MKITQNDLLDALRNALAKPSDDDALTGPELQRQLGVGTKRASDLMRVIQAEGRLEVVPVKRRALDGRIMSLKGYRIKPKGKP